MLARFRWAFSLLLVAALVSCGEATSPDSPETRVALAVARPGQTAAGEDIDSVHVVVFRSADDTAGTGSAPFPPELDSVQVDVVIELGPAQEQLEMLIDLLADGVIVFSSRTTIQIQRGELTTAPSITPSTWTQLVPTAGPEPRFGAAMVHDEARGRLVMFGGSVADELSSETWEYIAGRWEPIETATTPPGRAGHSMVWDPVNQLVVMFGGGGAEDQLNGTWTYNGVDWTQVNTANSPSRRAGAALVHHPTLGGILLVGGGSEEEAFDDVWLFDGADWTQLNVPPGPVARLFHAMVYDPGSDRVLLTGGFDLDDVLSDTWTFDGNSWTQGPGLVPGPRADHVMIFDPARGILLFGGTDGSDLLTDTWVNDGAWRRLDGTTPEAAIGVATALTASDTLFLFGGFDGDVARQETWRFAGAAWAKQPDPEFPAPRSRSAFERGVLFGGEISGGGSLGDTWVFRNGNWRQRRPATSPSARFGAEMAGFGNDALILFGGSGPGADAFGDTWRFGADGWSLVATSGPPARVSHALESMGSNIVLFGGIGSGGALGDTWTFNGSWSQTQSSGGPPARFGHTLTRFADGRLVLAGGSNGTQLFDDTWVFDGVGWTEVTASSTYPARRRHAAFTDPESNRVVIFGGIGVGSGLLADAWEFDGANWFEVRAGNGPGARSGAEATELDTGVLLFGGRTGVGPVNEAWIYR